MTISEILKDREFTAIDLVSSSCTSIQLITEDPHYIETMIKPIAPNDSCQFVLFSAPGAVGKSALAIVNDKNNSTIMSTKNAIERLEHSTEKMLYQQLI